MTSDLLSCASSVPAMGAIVGVGVVLEAFARPVSQRMVQGVKRSLTTNISLATGQLICKMGVLVGQVLGTLGTVSGTTTIALQLVSDEPYEDASKLFLGGIFGTIAGHMCIQIGAVFKQAGNELGRAVEAEAAPVQAAEPVVPRRAPRLRLTPARRVQVTS